MKIVLLGRSMEIGGAERQMSALAIGLAERGHEVRMLLFYRRGAFLEPLERAGIVCEDLGKRGRWDLPGFAWRLARRLRALKPDVVQSFLGPPNLMAAALRPFAGRFALAWGVRASNMDLDDYDWTHRAVEAVQRRLATQAGVIITNSRAGERQLLQDGYDGARIAVVENGIDVDAFAPGAPEAAALRRDWLAGHGGPLVILVARIDPMKDHATFLDAAARLRRTHPGARFVCVGDGDPVLRASLEEKAGGLGLGEAVLWTGPRSDIRAALCAADIATLSSAYGEGFPNALCEAMACAVPCVSTDVGDAARILDDPDRLVTIGDGEALAEAWRRLADLSPADRAALGQRDRGRIVEHYAPASLVARTERLYGALEA